MMPKFRKRPVELEAVQYLGFIKNGEEIEIFLGRAFESHLPSKNQIAMRTPHGDEVLVNVGDWIVQGENGQMYKYKP